MAKAVLLVFFFVMLAWGEKAAVRAEICSEEVGPCDADHSDCFTKCNAAHGPFTQSSCDSTVSPSLCTCFFNCPSPGRKICDGGAGQPCSVNCGQDCCNRLCANKYPGGTGICNGNLGSIVLCQCSYPC